MEIPQFDIAPQIAQVIVENFSHHAPIICYVGSGHSFVLAAVAKRLNLLISLHKFS